MRLLYNQDLEVRYNQYHLQELKNGVNTCGKWCSIKGLFPECNENDFNKVMRSTEYSADELVCLLYQSLK